MMTLYDLFHDPMTTSDEILTYINAHRNNIDFNQTFAPQSENYLHFAARRGFTEVIEVLCEVGVPIKRSSWDRHTPLTLAISCGHEAAALKLIALGHDVTDNVVPSPLPYAAQHNSLPVVQAILEKALELGIDLIDEFRTTALSSAIQHGSEAVALWLLDQGANLHNVCDPHTNKTIALHLAARNGMKQLVDILLELYDVDAADGAGNTPLQLALSADHPDIALRLLSCGAYVFCQNNQAETVIHSAASGGLEEFIKAFIEFGVSSVNTPSKQGTPLMYACSQGQRNTVKVLLEYGARYDSSILRYAAAGNVSEMIERAAAKDGFDLDERDEKGEPLIHIALRSKAVDVAHALLGYRVDVSFVQESGKTLLHVAAENGLFTIIPELLVAGLEVDKQDIYKHTPLYYAIDKKYDPVICALIEGGADIKPHLKDLLQPQYCSTLFADLPEAHLKRLITENNFYSFIGQGNLSMASALMRLDCLRMRGLDDLVKVFINCSKYSVKGSDLEGKIGTLEESVERVTQMFHRFSNTLSIPQQSPKGFALLIAHTPADKLLALNGEFRDPFGQKAPPSVVSVTKEQITEALVKAQREQHQSFDAGAGFLTKIIGTVLRFFRKVDEENNTEVIQHSSAIPTESLVAFMLEQLGEETPFLAHTCIGQLYAMASVPTSAYEHYKKALASDPSMFAEKNIELHAAMFHILYFSKLEELHPAIESEVQRYEEAINMALYVITCSIDTLSPVAKIRVSNTIEEFKSLFFSSILKSSLSYASMIKIDSLKLNPCHLIALYEPEIFDKSGFANNIQSLDVGALTQTDALGFTPVEYAILTDAQNLLIQFDTETAKQYLNANEAVQAAQRNECLNKFTKAYQDLSVSQQALFKVSELDVLLSDEPKPLVDGKQKGPVQLSEHPSLLLNASASAEESSTPNKATHKTSQRPMR